MIQMRFTSGVILAGSVGALFLFGPFGCEKSKKNDKPATGSESTVPAQSPAELAESVADIDGVRITVGEFQNRINSQSPYIRARYTSLERKKEFLDNLIRFEVLAKEAKRRGLDQDPEVVRTMKQVMIQKLMKEQFDTQVKPEDVSDAEMKKYFDEHQAEYNKLAEVRVSAIIVKDKATADKVAGLAKDAKHADNKSFLDLVTQYSKDEETKQRGGDLRYFDANSTEVPAPVVKAAFALAKAGDVAGPIATDKGFYIIKQTGLRQALTKTFDEVKRQIQNRLYRDKRTQSMDTFVSGLKAAAKITVHEDKLGQVRVDTAGAAAAPPGMPGMPGADVDPHGHGGAMGVGSAPGMPPGMPGRPMMPPPSMPPPPQPGH